jgi:16S rRNA (uracil1498-N3)-methyltransferase
MQLFYAPDIRTIHELPEEEARHALRVLRLGEGDTIDLTDGKGGFYRGIIRCADPKHCLVDVVDCREPLPLWDFDLHLAVAPTKHIDRMEWLCEKATEIGVNRLTFLNCRFSERREIKLSRLEKIVVSAMKQSQKATLPQLTGMTDFQAFIRQPFYGRRFIAHCYEGEKVTLKQTYQPAENVLALIGPEGDFSSDEVSAAVERGFEAISLGKSRLRTETAALMALHAIHLLNER